MAKRQKTTIPTLDTTYLSMQREMFRNGLFRKIGAGAYSVWSAIKSFADFGTGECWPSIRLLSEDLGMSTETVQRAIRILEKAHMLRVIRGRPNRYVARDRMDFRFGDTLLCVVVVDYAPARVKEALEAVKDNLEGRSAGPLPSAARAMVEIIPGPGMAWDQETGRLRGSATPPEEGQHGLTGMSTADGIKALKDASKGGG
jgi:DNA-binding Lrp family transcriptional regulator